MSSRHLTKRRNTQHSSAHEQHAESTPRAFHTNEQLSASSVAPAQADIAPAGHSFAQIAANASTSMQSEVGAYESRTHVLQAKALIGASDVVVPRAVEVNKTGIPDQIKAGIEALSGISLDRVKVHYNSSQPAQLQALAYAQGNDIHLAPGQERYLAHEAWHVIQQAQGRVRATRQADTGVAVNDDTGLEREADVMGAQALSSGADAIGNPAATVQRKAVLAHQQRVPDSRERPVQLKQLTTMGGTFDTGQYEALVGPIEVKHGEHTQDVGGVIDLSFTTNDNILGKFGIVQTGKAIRNKKADYSKDRTDLVARMQGETGSDPGRFLDRSKFKENPMFGLQNQKELLGNIEDAVGVDFTNNRNAIAERSGGKATIVKESLEEDHNISDVGGKIGNRTSASAVVPASMRDEPARTRHLNAEHTQGDAIRMEFETAAVVLNGDMEGTYLGTVSWGFEIGETDTSARPLPFEVISMGTPTPAFMESAQAWNDQATLKVGGNNEVPSLPMHVTKQAPDLALQKLLADASADKEEKITKLRERVAKLTLARDAMDPSQLANLKRAVTEATAKFEEAKRNIEELKRQHRDVSGSIDKLRDDRHKALTDRQTGQTNLDRANQDLNRVGNKTFFYRERRQKDADAVKAATERLVELDKALNDARNAVTRAESDRDTLTQQIAGFNTSKPVMDQRTARMNLQNEKADLNNILFELDYLTKELEKLE